MDARITKQRLSNLISYDWIKILCAIVAAVFVLILLFTMSATRPQRAQEFYIYSYTDLSAGEDFSTLADDLETRGAFSYDVLNINAEYFTGSTGSTAYTVRRSAGMGNVLFVTNNPTYQTDEDGNTVLDDEGDPVIAAQSNLYSMVSGGLVTGDGASAGAAYDPVYYMDACARYLEQFFGGDWRTSDVLDGTLTPEACFTARNGSDKRYRTEASRAQGIEEERARILKLREDCLAVEQALERGDISVTTLELDGGAVVNAAFDVGGLNGLRDLVYYTDGETHTTQNVNLVLLFNGTMAQSDLRFESLSFLSYLIEHYSE